MPATTGSSEKKAGYVLEARHVNYDNIAASAASAMMTSVLLSNFISGSAWTLSLQPDVPRNVLVTITDGDASLTAGTVAISGIDASGKQVTETHTYTVAGLYTGSVPFAVVQKVTTSFTGIAAGDYISAGFGNKIGLPIGGNGKLGDVYKACAAGANEAVGTVDKTNGTVIPTTVTSGTEDYDFWYTVEYPVR